MLHVLAEFVASKGADSGTDNAKQKAPQAGKNVVVDLATHKST